VDVEKGLRRCTKCGEWKIAISDNFAIATMQSPDGLIAQCKSCVRTIQQEHYGLDANFSQKKRQQASDYYWIGDDQRRKDMRLRQTHNITLNRYFEILDEQGGKCRNPACGVFHTEDRYLNVDHDHACCPGSKSCGQCVRGLLCMACNSAAGFVGDDPELLLGLVSYLNEWQLQLADRIR
jgi:hypothetical protein